jgi:hypothetical protein
MVCLANQATKKAAEKIQPLVFNNNSRSPSIAADVGTIPAPLSPQTKAVPP